MSKESFQALIGDITGSIAGKVLDDALAACDAGADALGFNFAIEAKRKNRFIEPEAARRIVEALPPFITTVAICVNDPAARIMEYLQFVDTVQLHGEETPAQCAAIGGRAIKAFRAGGDFQPESMLAYPTSAYLLDAQVAGARGGTGTVGDWDMARAAVALERPIILAGGLTPENSTFPVPPLEAIIPTGFRSGNPPGGGSSLKKMWPRDQ